MLYRIMANEDDDKLFTYLFGPYGHLGDKPTERHQCTFRSTSRRQFGFLAIA